MNIPLKQPVASSTETSDSEDSFGRYNGTGSEETDEDVEMFETDVVAIEELILD